MKKISLLLAFLSFMAGAAVAKEISLDEGSVVFTVPDEFTPLSAEEIAKKYPRANAPENVIGTADGRRTTVAYQLKAQPVQPAQLPMVQEVLTKALNQSIPGIAWKQNDLIDLAGQKWIMLEMTSEGADQDIHNMVLVTSHKGKMLMFNFNSTKKEFPKVEAKLKSSIRSIILTP